jgi:hypothetical protein
MRPLDELRRADPRWAAALDKVFESVVAHLLSQRVGGLSGKLEVTLNHSASVLKAEVKPTQVFTS